MSNISLSSVDHILVKRKGNLIEVSVGWVKHEIEDEYASY